MGGQHVPRQRRDEVPATADRDPGKSLTRPRHACWPWYTFILDDASGPAHLPGGRTTAPSAGHDRARPEGPRAVSEPGRRQVSYPPPPAALLIP